MIPRPAYLRRPAPPEPSSPPPSGPQTLHGSVKRIVYENAEEGYKVVRFVADQPGGGVRKGEEVVVTGALTGVNPGETLELCGQWSKNPKFGFQFAIESFRQVPPSTAEGIRAFLGSGLIAGIGKEYAGRIVKAFGEETLEVIDKKPERLREVEGIGEVRMEKILQGWAEHREIAHIMAFLQSYDISANWAAKIYKFYGNNAVSVMRENPYRLAMDIRGVGFKSADQIARSAGIAHDSEDRIRACVLHLLSEAAVAGHTFLPFEKLTEQALEMLGIEDPARIRAAVAALRRDGEKEHVVAELLPEGDKAVYLKGLHFAEVQAADYLTHIHRMPKALRPADAAVLTRQYEAQSGIEMAPEQREAVALALRGGVLVLTGGPGTGKTTTVRAVLFALRAQNLQVALAAPTGRAAKRLAETTRMDALTIHRLLKWDPKKGRFAHNERNTLKIDYMIVDEASMLDIALIFQLLKAVPPTASLLLVGDVDQLPSVGPGNVLRDIIASGMVPVVRLETIFRQAQHSLIVQNAHRINKGEFPILPRPEGEAHRPEAEAEWEATSPESGASVPPVGPASLPPPSDSPAEKDADAAQSSTGILPMPPIRTRPGRKSDFLFLKRENPEAALDTIVHLVKDRIPRDYGLDPIRDIQVITPMHRSLLGAASLNLRLQQALNPGPSAPDLGPLQARPGDKVMQVENDYDRDVYNGDIGIVASIDRTDHTVRVRFDHRLVAYSYADLDELTLSYAITVHKSQGSEYPAVVIPIHTQHFIMLQRNLFYTAVTRGKRLVVCVGTGKAIAIAVGNATLAERHSGLRQRLAHPEHVPVTSGPAPQKAQ